MRSCKFSPEVKNKKGEFVDSVLFTDLLAHTNKDRETVKYVYQLSKNREFSFANKESLVYDELREPTLDSLLKVIDISPLLNEGALAKQYSKELGTEKVYSDIDLILPKIIDFNNKELPFIATYEKVGKEYVIQVLPRINSTFYTSQNLKNGNEVSNKINSLFRSIGLEIDMGRTSTTIHNFNDPLNITQTTNDINSLESVKRGLLKNINISQGIISFYLDAFKNNPITQRLVNQYDTINKIKDSLGDDYVVYNEYYNGNINSLAEEAAIKDIQRSFAGEKITNNKSELLINKFKNLIKDNFNKFTEDQISTYRSDIKELLSGVENTYDTLEKPIINTQRDSYLHMAKRNVSKSQVLEKIIKDNIKMLVHRAHVYKKRQKGKAFSEKEGEKIKAMQNHLNERTYQAAVNDSLMDTAKWVNKVAEELDNLFNDQNIDWTNKKKLEYIGSRLREFKDFTTSYASNIQSIMRFPDMVKRGELDMNLEIAQQFSDLAKNIYFTMNKVYVDYNEMAKTLLKAYLKPFFKEDIVVDRGKRKGETITLDLILSSSDKDLSIASRFLNSAADSGDLAVALLDKVIVAAQSSKRLRFEKILHKIRESFQTFIVNGGVDTKFMFDYEDNGIPSGYIISDRDFGKYTTARKKFIASLEEQNLDELDYLEAMKNWEKENSTYIPMDDNTWEKVPNKSKYPSNKLAKLTSVQRKYYDTYLEIKKELDDLLPQGTTETYRAIQFMNSTTEAVLNTPKEAGKIIGNTILDNFTRTSNDTDFGVQGIKDFSGNKVDSVPIYYTNMLPDMRRLSLDASGGLAAYAEMAINYDEMNNIADIMEVSADVLNEREIAKTTGGKSVYSKIEGFGERVISKITEKGNQSVSSKRIRDMFSANIYGQRKKDEGSFSFFGTEIDVAKSFDTVINANSWAVMGYNLYAGINNIVVGKFQMFLEGIAGEYFNYKDMVIGDKNYIKDIAELLAEQGSTKVFSKLGLLSEMFDVDQSYGRDAKNNEFYKKNITRAFGKASSVYLMTTMGEHYMTNRTMLAYLNHYKMKSPSGKVVSLYDALEQKYKTSNGKKVGAKLQIKAGYTKPDGSAFTETDIIDISLKIGKINQSLHGIYNEMDKSVIQRWVLGRAVLQFRKWIVPHFNRRMKGLHYDMRLEQWKEGYYRSFPRVVFNIAKDLGHAELWAGQNWKNLTSNEKANFKRAMGELGTFLLVCGILTFGLGDYNDKETWASRMLMYHLYRFKAELGMSIPSIGMYNDAKAILNSPIAAFSHVNIYYNYLKIWDLWNIVERGKYEGQSVYYRDVMRGTPIIKQWNSVSDIKTEDYMFTPFVK